MNEYILLLMGPVPLNLLAAALLFAAAPLAGRAVALLCRLKLPVDGYLVDLALGLNTLALLALATSRGFLAAPPMLLWSALAVMAAAYPVLRYRDIRIFHRIGTYARAHAAALLLLAAGGLYMLGSALIPPYAWDEQTYQLALPVRWLATGSAAATADNPYSAFPSLPQFILLYGIKLGGLGAARLIILTLYLVIFFGAYDELRRISSKWTALLLVSIFAFAPVTGAMMREVYVEPFILLNLLAALQLRRLLDSRAAAAHAAGFGLLAGFTAAVKLTALGAAGAILVAGLPPKRLLKARWIGVAGGVALLAGGAFYLRPWLDLGNPVFPFAARFFAPGNAGLAEVEKFHQAMGSAHYGLAPAAGIAGGWLLAAFEWRIFDGIVMGWQFPLLIAAIAFGCHQIWKRGEKTIPDGYLIVMLLMLYVYWGLTAQQTRFLLPTFLIALFAAARAIGRIEALKVRQCCCAALVLATVVSFDRNDFLHFKTAWQYLGTARTRPLEMLKIGSRDPDYANMLAFVRDSLPADAGILLIMERRMLYFPQPVRNGTPFFQAWIFPEIPADSETLLAELRRREVDYILIGSPQLNLDNLPAYDEANALFLRLFIPLLGSNRVRYIKIPDAGLYSLLEVVRP